MIKKNILFLTLILFLHGCGFTPIFYKNNDVNFSIEQMSYIGDRELNNFLKMNLNKYQNKETNNKIYIKTESIYTKNILAKDMSGAATTYQIQAEVIFLIKPNDKEIRITEKKIMESKNDKFEETRYEKTIKQNFASSITNKLILELSIR